MIRTIILSILFMLPCLSINLSAQTLKSEATVNGIVKTSEGDVLADATIQLLDGQSRIIKKLVLSGQDGAFFISDVPAGNYVVCISYVGFEPIYKAITVYPEQQIASMGENILSLQDTMLEEITIYADENDK